MSYAPKEELCRQHIADSAAGSYYKIFYRFIGEYYVYERNDGRPGHYWSPPSTSASKENIKILNALWKRLEKRQAVC